MENGPFTDDFPNKTSIYNGFSIAMLNYQRVILWYTQWYSIFRHFDDWSRPFCVWINAIYPDFYPPVDHIIYRPCPRNCCFPKEWPGDLESDFTCSNVRKWGISPEIAIGETDDQHFGFGVAVNFRHICCHMLQCLEYLNIFTIWLFNIAMENPS